MAYEAQELWWVAVEGSTDPSGGWFLLADPGEAGAFQIQSAFKKAGIGIMAAVDAGSLCALAKTLAPGGSVSWRVKNNQCIAYQSVSSCAEALADIKELYPLDRVLLVSDQDPVHDLAKRMDEMVEGGGLKDIRQDLRCPPRGLGSWGLARTHLRRRLVEISPFWHDEYMTSVPPTDEARKALQDERDKTRRRRRSARVAAKTLAVWLDPSLSLNEPKILEAGDRWLAKLGESNTRRLSMRMRRMADWEMLRAEQMRDAGVSSWTLLKYIGASQDMVIDGPACRDTVYTDVMQKCNARKRDKGRQALMKAAIPIATVAVVATLATAGIGYLAATTGAAVGLDPQFAADVWQNWKVVFSPVLEKAKDLASDFDVATGGLVFVLGAFWMWAHDSRVAEDLRSKAAEKEVPTLEAAVGFNAKAHRIQSAIRSIPEHDRILLAHFSSTDLRAFLLGTDDERMHMLRENRPPLIAEFKSVLASRDRTWLGLLPTIKDIADVCMPKRWARAIGAFHPGEINEERMRVWRSSKEAQKSASPLVESSKQDELAVAARLPSPAQIKLAGWR